MTKLPPDQAMIEQTLSIKHDDAELEGTLSLPVNRKVEKVVLFIAGSGPLDRDQNSANIQLNVFNTVAQRLASTGIASLRYDKRGCGNSTGNYDISGHSDLVSDAAAWLHYLSSNQSQMFGSLSNSTTSSGSESQTGLQSDPIPIFLIGHSEGAIIAPQLAAIGNTLVAGQVLLCPFVENFESVIQRQAEKALQEIAELTGFKGTLIRFFLRLNGDQIAKQKKLIKRIRKTRKPTIKIRKQIINAKWIREMVELNPSEIYKSVTVPTLAIGGAKDVQCLPEDVDKLRDLVSAPLETHIVPDLTHILRADPDKPSTQHYTELSMLDIDERVLALVTQWLDKQ